MLLAPTWGCCVFKTLTIVLSMLLVSILIGYLMARLAKRNFGMVNGDVLGATNEIARPLVLITMIVVMTCLESVL
jgi:adenosylcobinamide-GDP ribazoletransferase